MNLNVVYIAGNLTRDIELKYTPSGTAVADFTVANNRKYKDREGNLQDETSFIGVTAFGKTAELCAQYLFKGSPILVEGRLKQESWESKDGKKQTKTKVVCQTLHFIGAKKEKPAGTSEELPADGPGWGPEDEQQ